MDYTTAPRSLIYRERRSLEEFGIYEDNPIMHRLSDAIFEFDFIRAPNAEERICWCMNNAFYICTMIFLEIDPKWRYDKYKMIATPEINGFPPELQDVTLSLVVEFLIRLEHPIPFLSNKGKVRNGFHRSMLNNENSKPIFNHIQKSLEFEVFNQLCIPNSIFAPRLIDAETVHDVLMDRDFNWCKFTNYWEERSLRDIVNTYGKTEDEKHNVVDILRQTAYTFYIDGLRLEEVKNMLNDIDEEIRSKYSNERINTADEKEETGKDVKITAACSDTVTKELEKLKAEVSSLQTKLQEANQTIEEFRQPVEELTAKNKIRMAFALKLLKEAGLTDETINIRKNPAKVARIMSLLLNIVSNNKRGNTAQICQTFLADNCKYYPQTQDTETLIVLNKLCSELDIRVCLSLEAQGNKKV